MRNNENRIIHCRNWDYSAASYLGPISFTGEYYKNNTLQFIADGPAGFLIPHTGIKHNKYAISLNLRSSTTLAMNINNLFNSKDYIFTKYSLYMTLL
jgi:hypothetical protein